MLDTKEKPVEGKVTEPAKVWQNRLLTTKRYRSLNDGLIYEPGDVCKCLGRWPSKDIAETMIAKFAREPKHVLATGFAEYLGAFPVTAP